MFLHLQFENATDAWIAHDMLMRALDELNRNSLVLTRNVVWKTTNINAGGRKPISINLSWIKSQWYKEWFFRASKYLEKKEDEAIEKKQKQSQEKEGGQDGRWQNALSSVDIDAVEEEASAAKRSSRPSGSSEGGNAAVTVSEAEGSGASEGAPVEPTPKKRKERKPKLIAAAKTGSTDSAETQLDDSVATVVVKRKRAPRKEKLVLVNDAESSAIQ